MGFREFKTRVKALARKFNVSSEPVIECRGKNYFARIPGIVKIFGSSESVLCTYRWGDGHQARELLPEV